MGAWIETSMMSGVTSSLSSLPSWERGLKHGIFRKMDLPISSLPSWERGLKPRIPVISVLYASRSLHGSVDWNYDNAALITSRYSSLPSWERGLKLYSRPRIQSFLPVAPFMGAWIETAIQPKWICWDKVAPFMGAWIETQIPYILPACSQSLPSWERGLKPVST